MQDPEFYLNQLGIELTSIMDDTAPAIIDDEHWARVNYETFFFANVPEREEFVRSTTRYCGLVTDPITAQRFVPNEQSPKFYFEGQPFYFLSKENREEFAAMPESLAVPKYRMIGMEENPMMGEESGDS